MRRRYRGEVGYVQNFITLPESDSKFLQFSRFVAYKLLDVHRLNETLLHFIFTLIPESSILDFLVCCVKETEEFLDTCESLMDDLRESLFSPKKAVIPHANTIQEVLDMLWNSEHRPLVIRLLKEQLEKEMPELSQFHDVQAKDSFKLYADLFLLDSFFMIQEVFGLEEVDLLLLLFFYLPSESSPFYDIFDEWSSKEIIKAISIVFGIPQKAIMDRFYIDKPLLAHDLLEEESRRSKGYTYELNDTLVSYISLPGKEFIYEEECRLDTKEAYPLKSFYVDLIKENTCLDLLARHDASQILLFGKEGTGKTEYARALANKLGKKLYIFKHNQKRRGSDEVFRLNLIASSLNNKEAILLVDEADSLLSTSPYGFFSFFGSQAESSKSKINDLLDTAKCSIIWITNRIQQIDASTKRRFVYSIEFSASQPKALKEQAISKLQPLGLSDELIENIASMAARNGLNTATVEFVAHSIKVLPDELKTGTEEANENLLKRVRMLFETNSRLLTGTIPFRSYTQKNYSIDAINASVDPQKLVEAMARYFEMEAEDSFGLPGLRVLFHGESGTGKTEFARYIAEQLNRPLLIKRASDILSPWVGMSEQNVASVFKEAEDSRSILLLDEADSFFNSRDKAVRNWERTLVNEFLTRMEEFRGVLLCSTNAIDALDTAVMRRFHQIIELYPLTADGITELLALYFPKVNFDDSEVLDLFVSGSITPGDFAALHGRLLFAGSDFSSSYICEELVSLAKFRQKEM